MRSNLKRCDMSDFLVCLFVFGFHDMSTLVGHFVSSPREREKRDSRGDEREGQGRKRKMNESEEAEEIKTFPLYPFLLQRQQGETLPKCKPISVECPGDARYTTLLPYPTIPNDFLVHLINFVCQTKFVLIYTYSQLSISPEFLFWINP